MKRPQERYAFDEQDDYEKLVTDVDPEQERRVLGGYKFRGETGSIVSRSTKIFIGLIIVGVLGATGWHYWSSNKQDIKDKLALAVPDEVLQTAEGDTPAEPAASASTKAKPGAEAEPVEGIIGDVTAVGNASVCVQDVLFKTMADKGTMVAVAGAIGNAGKRSAELPKFSVGLFDTEDRRYDPVKTEHDPVTGVLNPLLSVQHKWAFNVPANVKLTVAAFNFDGGSAEISLTERNADNQAVDNTESQRQLNSFVANILLERPAPPPNAFDEKLAHEQAALQTLQGKFDEAKAQNSEMGTELDAERAHETLLDARLKNAHSLQASAASKLDRAKTELAIATQRYNDMKATMNTTRTISGRDSTEQVHLDHAQHDVDSAQTHVDDATRYLAEKDKNAKALEDQKRDIRLSIETLAKSMQTSGKGLDDLRKSMEDSQDKLDELQKQGGMDQ